MEAMPAEVLALTTHADDILLTVQLMTHSGDVHLAPRALASVMAQTIPHRHLEIVVTFDGEPDALEEAILVEACAEWDGPANLVWAGKKSGYYCVPRNQTLPALHGHYIAHMDADNEWRPDHLLGLLTAIRVPDPHEGWPHFVYSRREYVRDDDCTTDNLPLGPSPLVPWTDETVRKLLMRPLNNFVDTGDLLIGRGALIELAERSGCVWNSNMRRFGDWDLVCRLARAGLRGRAVDQVTHIYHWTGKNLQITRKVSDLVGLPESVYERMKDAGLILDHPEKPNA